MALLNGIASLTGLSESFSGTQQQPQQYNNNMRKAGSLSLNPNGSISTSGKSSPYDEATSRLISAPPHPTVAPGGVVGRPHPAPLQLAGGQSPAVHSGGSPSSLQPQFPSTSQSGSVSTTPITSAMGSTAPIKKRSFATKKGGPSRSIQYVAPSIVEVDSSDTEEQGDGFPEVVGTPTPIASPVEPSGRRVVTPRIVEQSQTPQQQPGRPPFLPLGSSQQASSQQQHQGAPSSARSTTTSVGIHRGFYNYSASPVPTLALTTMLTSSNNLATHGQLSARSSNACSTIVSTRSRMTLRPKPCANVLVLGSRQVGKSAFINAFRAVNTASIKWPVAPVGMCGRHGTTSVDPCPNNSSTPSWILVDTPGRLYTELHSSKTACSIRRVRKSDDQHDGEEKGGVSPSRNEEIRTDLNHSGNGHQEEYNGDDAVLLDLLFEGLPWRTRLVGPKSSSLSSLSELPPRPENKAHHAIIVLSAKDVLQISGNRFWRQYKPAPKIEALRSHLADFLEYIRVLLGDRAPFVLITHMDEFSWRKTAETKIKEELKYCVPLNRVYFLALPNSATAEGTASAGSPLMVGHTTNSTGIARSSLTLAQQMEGIAPKDEATKLQLMKLHQDIQTDLAWFYKTSAEERVLDNSHQDNIPAVPTDMQRQGSGSAFFPIEGNNNLAGGGGIKAGSEMVPLAAGANSRTRQPNTVLMMGQQNQQQSTAHESAYPGTD